MRILVYPHELAIGGSQINAIDLAATMRDLGHEAIIYGQRGPLVDYVTEEKGLPFVAAHELRYRPAPTRIAQLARLVRREQIDLVHAYEWPPCLDAYYGAHLLLGVPVVATVLSMGFTPLIPTTVPLLMGTYELAADVAGRWPGRVGVMEPPIDTAKDHPGNDGRAFRQRQGVRDDEILVVSVSRLSVDLKLDALKDVIDAVGALGAHAPVRLILVGDGDAADELARRAAAVNEAVGRVVVELAGPLMDPRAAYAAADIVAGMGSSALRAMAHAKPVVVQGEHGFARLFDEQSAEQFLWAGFYGLGPGGSAAAQVEAAIAPLLTDPARRRRLGDQGRELVVERFSLAAAARRVLDLYEETLLRPATRGASWAQGVRVGARAAGNEIRIHDPRDKSRRQATRAAQLTAAAASPELVGPSH